MKFTAFIHGFSASALTLLAVPALAVDGTEKVAQLSLEDLMKIEVTSVSKKPQRLAHVAAAVHVISAEDIRLSGANSIAEVLRLAPGMDATRFSANRWSASARGFAELLADKLLVLVDGRNAFNPAFSGVMWQDFQFPLEDIERIEVIRGPAAAIWGSNGMNGVINIITRSAASTPGGLAVLGTSTLDESYGRVRWGGQNADGSLFYRVYGSTQHASAQRAPASLGGGSGQDAYGTESAGLRLDGYLAAGARWDMSADFFSNHSDGLALMHQASGTTIDQQTERHRGTTLRARYEKGMDGGGNLQFQGAYAQTTLRIPYVMTDERNTVDLDMQHRFQMGKQQELVWGINYRLSSDTITPGLVMHMDTPSRRMNYLGLFAQDEINLADTWRLTLGLRMDRNPISGWDAQPTARLSWNLQPNQTIWGALSKAARAPSRADAGFNRNLAYIPGTLASYVPNTLLVLHGAEDLRSEQLKAAELGLRSQWASALSTDLVLFTHRYDQLLRTAGQMTPVPGFPLTVVNIDIGNGGAMTVNGAELAADWRINPAWRLQLAQTWNSVTQDSTVTPDPTGTLPKSITSLRLSWTPASRINIDAWLRHTGARPGVPSHTQLQRNAFSGFDLRLGWTPRKNMAWSLVGQNLNQGSCDALSGSALVASNTGAIPSCQPRSLLAQLRLEF
ncbi:MAG: TonB-dependent receptor [Gammaproteobacteria bacterium]|uniref:TonB-dependent receptor plug domain-containing protein n=1 Tax=Rhodoferax sp. TaxID=50421 RepID=UPI001D781D58|nr:TonB-dependent receptor [Rhodoferax sp.]MBU3898694.1 TonB-dependent receptor [Gammaproteobacteria bacterium]MBU4019483.1 TonB-dependent receptor [Gammaproteobacteria bacterium]MBU4079450.1 TonB-dependent receptor [Gammaproteobacteria bacterium]MBU4115133.1 TonB-dependent receptor [Gammaproteobacteria bacterium]MBU4172770.1 TonB-dependent receptor [Gammaproteobacteria bacterium]